MRRLFCVLAATAVSSTALAAGIDSRTYTCADLHGLIATAGFVFIGNPDFQDFVVADGSYCSGGGSIELRSVATRDSPECLVNYCKGRRGGG